MTTTYPSLLPEIPEMVELRIGPALYRVARDGSYAECGQKLKRDGTRDWLPMHPDRARWLAGLLKEKR